LAGSEVPPGLDGISFKPLLDGQAKPSRDTLFLAYMTVQRAIRDRDWKLIRYPQINKTQLFDLKNDPDEIKDLASDRSQANRVSRMMSLLQASQGRLGDSQPLTSDSPRASEFTPPKGEALDKLLERWKMKTR
jgi:arylsulfatase A-like enzyme